MTQPLAIEMIFSIVQWENWGSEILYNLPQIIHIIGGGVVIRSLAWSRTASQNLYSNQSSTPRNFQSETDTRYVTKRIPCLLNLGTNQYFLISLSSQVLCRAAAELRTNTFSVVEWGWNLYYNEVKFICNIQTPPKWKKLSECQVFLSNFMATNRCFHTTILKLRQGTSLKNTSCVNDLIT